MSFEGPLSDRIEIRELIDTYGNAVALRDAEQWAATWAEDCVWVLPTTRCEGKKNVVSTWVQAMAGYPFAYLSSIPGSISVTGNRAKARVNVEETIVDTDGKMSRLWSHYDDEFAKIDGRWLFTSRTYNVHQHKQL